MSDLRLAKSLVLPEKFATEGVVAVGMRGSGKSNTLVRWAEVLYENKIPFVAIDPKGDWYGIKSSADGKRPGLSVPIFGGLHEDFPLTHLIGARIADLLVDQNMSAVLDVSRLSIENRATFLTTFCNRLMDRHQVEPHVRCVILEEAHRYIPQNVTGKTAAVKEATASILLEGRAFGLGCWAATQRPARLHKDVLEEVGTVFLHRVGAAATNDLKTINGWLKHEDIGDEVAASLTRLDPGEAWLLSPSDFAVVQRVKVDRRKTYDTGATPLVGAGSRPTLTLADIDQGAIKEALAEVIEQAKANDPKELKIELARTRKSLTDLIARTESHRCPEPVQAEPEIVEVEVEVIPAWVEDVFMQVQGVHEFLTGVVVAAKSAPRKRTEVRTPERTKQAPQSQRPRSAPVPQRTPERTPARTSSGPSDKTLGKAGRSILTVLAQFPNGRNDRQTAMLAGYTATKGFSNAVSALRTSGYVVGGKDLLRATEEGLAVLGEYEPLPDDLFDYWLNHPKVGKAERAILEALHVAYPNALNFEDLADAAEYEPTKGFSNSVSKLRTLDIIEGGRDAIRINDTIMEGTGA